VSWALQLIAQQELGLDIVGGNISDFAENFVNDWFLARSALGHGGKFTGPWSQVNGRAAAVRWHRRAHVRCRQIDQVAPVLDALCAARGLGELLGSAGDIIRRGRSTAGRGKGHAAVSKHGARA
jgi:hypothetical protein